MKNRFSSWSNVALFTLIWLAGCTSPSKKPESHKASEESFSVPLDQASPRENRDYQEIENLFVKNDFEATQIKIQNFSKHHPHGVLLPSVENLYGLLLLKNKKAVEAIDHFNQAIQLNPKNEQFNQYVLYNLATAQYEAEQIDAAQQTAANIQADKLDKANRLKLFYLKASIYQKKSLPLEASRQLLTAGLLLSSGELQENRKLFNKLLDQSLQAINDLEALQRLYQEFEDSPIVDSLLFRLGSQEMALGNTGTGEAHFKLLNTRFPQNPYYAQVNEILSRIQNQSPVESKTVGVLLPIKGKFGKYGLKSLQGIQMAFGIFNSDEPDQKLTLVVEDAGDEPEQAIKALNKLVLKDHVIAVIGPMLTKGVDQISQRAQELGVPLISLARRASTAAGSDYVFQGGLTQQIQAYEMARYAYDKLNARRFALIYPNDKLGTEVTNSFWDAIESLGGKIVGAESYAPGETDFRKSIDRLSGTHYAEARQRELDLLAQERDANNIKKKTRKTEQFFNLKPIVDYDAVFIPDEPKVAGQIIPTFAYRDVDHVQFLGTSSWNTPDFLSRGQNYIENAAFVDALFLNSSNPDSQKFVTRYRNTYSQDPTPMEALAFDAAKLVQDILTSSRSGLSRSEMRDKLKKVSGFPGVTGKISYQDGQFFRNLKVITVKGGQFAEAR